MAKVKVYGNIKQWSGALILCLVFLPGKTQYQVNWRTIDKDSMFIRNTLQLQSDFKSRQQSTEYLQKLPLLMQKKGFSTASIDSIHYDSSGATVHLYIGEAFRWAQLEVDSTGKEILESISVDNKTFINRTVNFQQFESVQKRILDYLENNGYPFARVELDSIVLKNGDVSAKLKVHKGPLYKIDSIRNFGSAKISDNFLQRYLGISNGSIYKKEKLQLITKKINELTFVREEQPWSLTLLGTGSVLNMYLVPKRSSLINVLVGFLPSTQQSAKNKILITGEATVNLKNALGNGETIGLNWQQIQVKSPRLNILFQQPYLFRSPFGVNFNFDLFKKDSSFVNISLLLGLQYSVSSNQSGSVFIQNLRTNLLTVDTFFVKNNRRLPAEADLTSMSVGINYEWFNTDYRFNPLRGNELQINTSVGTKKISKNNVVAKLRDETDPSFDFNSLYDTLKLSSYQFRVRGNAAHYFPLTKVSTLKSSLHAGVFYSPNIFRNELFQIGGYKLLRGFDEESIFASMYGVLSNEYRYLLRQNSFLFTFIDLGWARNSSQLNAFSNTFIGAGLGMAFETKAGIFNISYAAGKRNDADFNLRQSKIHLGYVNYF